MFAIDEGDLAILTRISGQDRVERLEAWHGTLGIGAAWDAPGRRRTRTQAPQLLPGTGSERRDFSRKRRAALHRNVAVSAIALVATTQRRGSAKIGRQATR
jgi:hypothetical protein